MREIKFRAWIEKDAPDLFDGATWQMKRYCAMKDVKSIHFGTGKIMVSDAHGNHSEHPDNYKLMQYTGLKDCNGVKIFEGDIVRDHNGVGEVQYSDKKASFKVNYHDGFSKWFLDYNLKGERESIKVIGNIHQNPELLERTHG